MKSINKYEGDIDKAIINGIVTPLSLTIDNIGAKTSEIDAKLTDLKTRLDEIPEFAQAPLHYSILLGKKTDCFNKKGNSLISGCYSLYISLQYS
ncbi:hypothetical protein IYZ83_000345 [Wolbachia pipientis]|uniref:hypothetical protein n=1 Tax=Wolbachia pipientis TaxID=955 RepID=UPI001F2C4781|nr:hypothetical protein [Wolbachia pipientis]UIP91726.1 hypothetical protein IYZ83_000345 [Wolbachia pipientis]